MSPCSLNGCGPAVLFPRGSCVCTVCKMFTEEFQEFAFLILCVFVWKAAFLLQLLLNFAINMCLKPNGLTYDFRAHALWVAFSLRDREGLKDSQGSFLCYRCLPDLTQVSIVLSVSFHIPALAQGRSALFTSRRSMGRGLDGLFSHLAMKQRQWQHTMAWWWTNIRSNTRDDLPSDRDLKSRCVSFWCCLKSLKCFETTNQIKCSQLGKQRQASPKKGPVASHGSHRCRASFAWIRLYMFYYLHYSTSIYVQNDKSPIYNLSIIYNNSPVNLKEG